MHPCWVKFFPHLRFLGLYLQRFQRHLCPECQTSKEQVTPAQAWLEFAVKSEPTCYTEGLKERQLSKYQKVAKTLVPSPETHYCLTYPTFVPLQRVSTEVLRLTKGVTFILTWVTSRLNVADNVMTTQLT